MDRGHKVLDPKEPVGDRPSVVRLSVKKGVKCSKPAFEMSLGLSHLRADVGLPVRRLSKRYNSLSHWPDWKNLREEIRKSRDENLETYDGTIGASQCDVQNILPQPPACQQ